jgi:hypothetical protein
VKRQSRLDSEPERSVVDRSEIEAVQSSRIAKGYWDSTVRHLLLLGPDQALKLAFKSGQAPHGIRSSIHMAAARSGVRVGVKVSGAVVYIWRAGARERAAAHVSRPLIKCEVCGKLITPRLGVSKQYVCAGKEGQKSECQKTRRYAREHGISIAEAIARRQA